MEQAGAATMMPEPLLSMQKLSMELRRVSVMGNGCLQSPPPPPSSTDTAVRLLRLCELLKQQKFELKNRIDTNQISVEDVDHQNVTVSVGNIVKEIRDLQAMFEIKKMFLERLQLYDSLHSHLFERSKESQLLTATMEHSRRLSSLIANLQHANQELETELTEIAKNRCRLKQNGEESFKKIRSMEENPYQNLEEVANIRDIQKYLEKNINKTRLIQNIFQMLILSSRVHWAEDPKLREVVLKMRQDPGWF